MYSLRLGGRSAARANMLNTTLRLRVLRDGAESSRRPYQTSRRHPRTYILALRVPAIFSRLSTAILTFIQAVEPYLQRHPSVNVGFAFLSSPYIPPTSFPVFLSRF